MPPLRRLHAVFFDIDDTLCATTAFAQRARRNAVRGMLAAGLRGEEERVYRELEEVIAEFSANYEHHFDKLLLRLPEGALAGHNPALVVAAGVAAYHDTKFRELAPFPGVRELLADLRAVGVRVGIITHGLTVKQAEKLVRLGLVPHLDPGAIFISDQIGVAKPNPKIYQFALERCGVEAARALYVGDNPRNDIAPPRQLGMLTCWARLVHKHELGDMPRPDFEIETFADLRALLRQELQVDLPA
ncbi:MAG: TIGR02253 family HAD-type hydrolase [Planctomycetes bacterium]|nr:TIGR02253 family HAD-type hydrolase [Planctomycetota bacterium]MBM3987224.1 TIGR02253 family HAD-type hydrolase [Planctomycetota bacterium]